MPIDPKDSLNMSELPSFWDNDIYIIDEKKTPQDTSSQKPSGSSEKKSIVVILNDEKEKSYEEPLKKIFNAVQINIKDIYLLNIHKSMPDLSEIKFKILISFGVSPDNLKLKLEETTNEIKEINNTRYLFASTFEEMEKDINKKKKFWSSFQTLFK